MLQPAVLLHELGQLIVVGRVLELGLDVVHAALDATHLASPGQHFCQRRSAPALCNLLAQVADDGVPAARDRPGVGLLVARDELEQCRLAGPVGADDGNAAACADQEADVAEEMLRAVALGHAADRHEAHGGGSMVARAAFASAYALRALRAVRLEGCALTVHYRQSRCRDLKAAPPSVRYLGARSVWVLSHARLGPEPAYLVS